MVTSQHCGELYKERRAYKKEHSSRSQSAEEVQQSKLLIAGLLKGLKPHYSIEEDMAKGESCAQRRCCLNPAAQRPCCGAAPAPPGPSGPPGPGPGPAARGKAVCPGSRGSRGGCRTKLEFVYYFALN